MKFKISVNKLNNAHRLAIENEMHEKLLSLREETNDIDEFDRLFTEWISDLKDSDGNKVLGRYNIEKSWNATYPVIKIHIYRKYHGFNMSDLMIFHIEDWKGTLGDNHDFEDL